MSYSLHKVTRYHLSIFTGGEICVWCTYIFLALGIQKEPASLFIIATVMGKPKTNEPRMEQATKHSIGPKGEQNAPPVCTNSDSDAT